MPPFDLYTIGHSNHSADEFLDLLRQHEMEALADVRRFPGSRAFPHFNQERLSHFLEENGITYQWFEELGGRRRRPTRESGDSPNQGLRHKSFRDYADYMATDAFGAGIDRLAELARSQRTTIMCAESVFWRCHRRLISDFVVLHGGTVAHIFPNGRIQPHSPTPEAQSDGELVTYPGERTLLD